MTENKELELYKNDPFSDYKYRGIKGLRGENYKPPAVTEEEYEYYTREIIKCFKEPMYFIRNYYKIIAPGKGEIYLNPHTKQETFINYLFKYNRIISLMSRQNGKSTAYCAYLTHLICFKENVKICILADSGDTAKEFIDRISFAFQNLPQWIKPAIVTWNKHTLEVSNGCKIESKNTTPKSARGLSYDIIIFDEFAWVDDDFSVWQAAYPSISSSPDTQAVLVSTPNGTGNKFYDIWSLANSRKDTENTDGWVPLIAYWHEVPGRDEKWKQMTIESLDDKRAWDIEYDLKFIGGETKLINNELIVSIKNRIITKNIKPINVIKVGANEYEIDIFYNTEFNHAYVVGVDVADGSGNDYSVVKIFDVTNIRNIKEAASFRDNTISPSKLSYIICRLAYYYNTAPAIVEYNNVGSVTCRYLNEIYCYDNMFWYNENTLGIISGNSVKNTACLHFKSIMENCSVEINDWHLSTELEHFVRKQYKNSVVYEAEKKFHDDCVDAAIWALYILHLDFVQNYFEDVKYTEINGELYPETIINIPFDRETISTKIKSLDRMFNRIESGNMNENKSEIFKDDFSLDEIIKDMNENNTDDIMAI